MNAVVLYIEDDPGNIRLVERLIKRRPEIALRTATTAADGVAAALAQPPALVLLDNRLPDASGTDVLRELTAAEATAGIPVVILTGDSGQDTADAFLAGGAAGFLPKPFDIHQFMAMLDRYLP